MQWKVLNNEREYEAALARIDQLMDAVPGTPDGNELELLIALVEAYEDKHFPIGEPCAEKQRAL